MSIAGWIDRNLSSLGREMRVSYLPPLMVYVALGVSTLTTIVGIFFVKEYLGLSAEFLAALAFWTGIPYVLKMPLGHLVDLLWRYKNGLLYVGAMLIAASLATMYALLAHTEAMRAVVSIETWYVAAALILPIGFVLQDVVADAMTVEAVPRHGADGKPLADHERKAMNTTMQTLGRIAVIGGSLLVAVVNMALFSDVESMSQEQKAEVYARIYALALGVPALSVLGVVLHAFLLGRERRRLSELGADVGRSELPRYERTRPNWWILGGSLVFVAFSLALGLSQHRFAQEMVFAGSLAIVLFLIYRLMQALAPEDRAKLAATITVVFAFRAIPSAGEGLNWWMIDELAFDPGFFALLSMIGAVLTLAGMIVFRRFMAEHSIAYVVTALTIVQCLIALPILALYHGVHHWTASLTGGIVDARFIAIVNTAVDSPLHQIAMIPVLAWIAHSAPNALKATYFAVMGSFLNLALSGAQLGTKYLNQLFTVSREVKDAATGAVVTAADYSELGELLVVVIAIGFAVPMLVVLAVKLARLPTA